MSRFQAAVHDLAGTQLPRDPAGIVDELRELETLKCAAEARQARLAAALDAVRVAEDRGRGLGASGGAAVHAEVAFARRVSPHQGKQLLSLARVLDRELPHTRAAFNAGLISQWRVTLIARETACLPAEHRASVDEALAADPVALSQRGDREIRALALQMAARLDAAAVARRRRKAETERRVSIRPAPDSMVYLTALLPVADGVGLYATIKAAATTAVGTGAATNLGQGMADELVARVRGHAPAQPVALRLTMSADALLDQADDPAWLADYGPIPAEAARALVADNLENGVKVWLKRLYTKPETGQLIGMDSRARLFPPGLAEFIELRDRWCRNPWCDAPIRHHDHIRRHTDGGPTSAANGQGLCETCSYVKEATGWTTRIDHRIDHLRGHEITLTTPTGHQYQSRAPAA